MLRDQCGAVLTKAVALAVAQYIAIHRGLSPTSLQNFAYAPQAPFWTGLQCQVGVAPSPCRGVGNSKGRVRVGGEEPPVKTVHFYSFKGRLRF